MLGGLPLKLANRTPKRGEEYFERLTWQDSVPLRKQLGALFPYTIEVFLAELPRWQTRFDTVFGDTRVHVLCGYAFASSSLEIE